MENYAYEKRALLQSEPKKSYISRKKVICIGVLICVSVLSTCMFLDYKKSAKSKANPLSEFEITFNNKYSDYTYDEDSMKSDFGRVNFIDGNRRLFIKDDALCVQYPRGSEGVNKSGARINTALEGREEYNLEYEIYFDGNGNKFDWQEGGMLSGLAGGKFYDGTAIKTKDDGFHAMLIYNNYGYLYPCVYAVNDAEVGGNIYQSIGKATEGTWLKVKMNVKLNDVGESNGRFKVWLDDKLSYNADNIRYRTRDLKVNIANIGAYSNISDNGDGAKHEEFVFLDNIRVY